MISSESKLPITSDVKNGRFLDSNLFTNSIYTVREVNL